MTTTPGSGERSGDGAVHSLLWRLRARLVTPPAEERVRSDLDRLLAAAQQQAHVAPSADATARPDVAAAAATSPDSPLVAVSTSPEPGSAGPQAPAVDELARRRTREPHGIANALTRIAAAGVAIVVVGTGVAAATDGQVSLLALLARDEVAVPDVAADLDTPALAAPAVDGADADADAAAADAARGGDPAGSTLPGPDDQVPPDAGAGTEVEGDGPDVSDDAAGTDGAAGSEPGPSDTPAPGSSSSEGSGSSGSSGSSSDGGSSSDAGERGSSDTGGDEPVTDPGEQVIAAPPSSGVDGFGGTRCAEDRLEDCLVEEGGPVDDGGAADDADDGDDLASRRFQPERATSTEGTATTQATTSTSTVTTDGQ